MTIIRDWNTEKVLHVRYVGEVSGQEYLESVLNFSGDARFDGLKYLIADWSEYSYAQAQSGEKDPEARFNEKDIEKAAAYTRAMAMTNPNIKLAMVLMKKSIGHRGAFATLFESLSEGISWEVASFNTLAEAKVWLGLEG